MFYCIDYLHVLSVLSSSQTRCKINIFFYQSEIFSQLKRMGPLGPLPWKVMCHILKSWDNDQFVCLFVLLLYVSSQQLRSWGQLT